MLRPRSMLPFAAIVATLLACGSPGTRGEPAPALGPYAVVRTSVVSPVRAEPPSVQDARGGAAILRDSRRMCDLHGGKGSC